MQAPEFIYGECKKCFHQTRSARKVRHAVRKTTSLFQAPKFIYGDSNFEFIILNFELSEGVTPAKGFVISMHHVL